MGGWLDLDRELRTDVQPSVRVRWMCLAAGTVTVAATAFVLFAVRGPDPCLPLACSNFGWSFRVYNLAPALTGLQAVLLFVGLAGAAALLAVAATRNHRGLLVTVLVAATIPLGIAIASASSATGTWFDANGQPQDGSHRSSLVNASTGCGEILFVEWPLGSALDPKREQVWFARDPEHRLDADYLGGDTDLNASLPPDARDTGYRRGNWHLWLVPGNRAAFLRSGQVVEQWPLVVQQFGCA